MTRLRGYALVLLACTSMAVAAAPGSGTRSGGEIMQRFHAGTAQPGCVDASDRWRRHYAQSASRLAKNDTALALFGYVVDAVRRAGLPSEFALIPFIESSYRVDARSIGGPAGLWQFTAATARRHGLRVQGEIDHRMSAAGSTRAAVAYLRRLHRMFGGDWQRTVMAYNAGEGALKASWAPQSRPLSGITRSYPRKLHAIACLLHSRRDDDRWRQAIQRQVPRLAPRRIPARTLDLRDWSSSNALDAEMVAALNPAWRPGDVEVLAPVGHAAAAGRNGPGKAN